MKEEVKRWFSLAKDDLNSAQVNFNNNQHYVCVFLCQQSVEKALKSSLIKKTGKLLRIHDLVVLGEKINLPKNILKKCDKLNGVYLDTRYGDLGGRLPSEIFNKSIASDLLNTAKEVVIWLEKNI